MGIHYNSTSCKNSSQYNLTRCWFFKSIFFVVGCCFIFQFQNKIMRQNFIHVDLDTYPFIVSEREFFSLLYLSAMEIKRDYAIAIHNNTNIHLLTNTSAEEASKPALTLFCFLYKKTSFSWNFSMIILLTWMREEMTQKSSVVDKLNRIIYQINTIIIVNNVLRFDL